MPELVNAVGGGNLYQELDLLILHNSLNGDVIRYDPEHWPGLYIRFNECSPTVLVFRTGKYNIAGADSLESLHEAKDDFLSRLEEIGLDVSGATFEVRNLVTMDDFNRELNLEALTVGLGLEDTEYEPEQFPGLIYSQPGTEGTFLIFTTGKILLTGSSDLEQGLNSFDRLFEKLQSLFAE